MSLTPTESAPVIIQALERLADLGEAHGMRSLASEIRDERLPAVREGRMQMVVLGEFNHGKSSTINALLGSPVLPTGITPTTSVITLIRHGTGQAKLVLDERTETLTHERLREVLTSDAPADLRHVEIEVQSDWLAEGLVVVDTPGVNDISRQKVEITYGFVPRADVVLYVLDATQALKRSEITFIRDRLLRNSVDRLFFVVGKIDALSPDEQTEVMTHVRTRLHEMLGDVPIFAISARRAVLGQDPGFDALRTALQDYLRAQRARIVLEGGLRTGLRMAGIIDQSLAIEQGAMHLADDELARRIESARGRLSHSRALVFENLERIDRGCSDISGMARENVRSFVHEFLAALPREIDRGQVDDIKRYLPDFIHDTYKEFLEAEGEHVAMRLEALAEEIITITNRNMREALEGIETELGVRARDLNLEVDTFGYDVGVFALGALGVGFLAFSNLLVGGLLTLSAPVLAFVMKDRVDTAVRERALEQGKQAITTAGLRVEDEFERVVADFRDRLRQFLEDAGERLYRQIGEALDRVQADRQNVQQHAIPLVDRLQTGREAVSAIREDLLRVRQQLIEANEATDGAAAAAVTRT